MLSSPVSESPSRAGMLSVRKTAAAAATSTAGGSALRRSSHEDRSPGESGSSDISTPPRYGAMLQPTFPGCSPARRLRSENGPMAGSVVSARRFHGLMPYRVREVLLVASPYDAFILEEDGLLTEQVFLEYMDVSQPGAPRFTHARSGKEALALLAKRRFDLVLTTAALPDMPAERLGREVKALRPGRPVVLLALDRAALREPGGPGGPQSLDRAAVASAFLWASDAKILPPLLKSVEDRENIDDDIATAGVRAILILEDSPRFYSSFLGMLYKELMQQSHSLYSEGVDEMARQLYMKSRPKVLHATTWEEGMALF